MRAETPATDPTHVADCPTGSAPTIVSYSFVRFDHTDGVVTGVYFHAVFDAHGVWGPGSFGGIVDGYTDQGVGGGWGNVNFGAYTYDPGFTQDGRPWFIPGTTHSSVFTVSDSCGDARSSPVVFTIPRSSGTTTTTPGKSQPSATDCPAAEVIGSRGSGDPLSKDIGIGAPGLAFKNALQLDLHVGPVKVFANPYAASAALGSPTTVQIGLESKLWFQGVQVGEAWLASKVRAEIVACPTASLYLTGYSQGAEITGDVYSTFGPAIRSHIAGVVLFGDPRYKQTSFAGRTTQYQKKTQAHLRHNGALSTRGEFPTGSRGKILSYCHARDPICQGLGQLIHGIGAHTSYQKTFAPRDAAAWFTRDLKGHG